LNMKGSRDCLLPINLVGGNRGSFTDSDGSDKKLFFIPYFASISVNISL